MLLPVDTDRDAAAPVPRSSPSDRSRFAVVQVGTLALAAGVVLVVSAALPFLPGWVLPTVLVLLTVVLVACGRRAAGRGSSAGARAWAAWAGVTGTLGLSGVVGLVGLGGALVALLLVVVALQVGLALWFRSPVHFAVAQLLALAWGLLAHVYDLLPWATLVAGLAGSWWTVRVGAHRVVTATTTVVVPLAAALLVHPLTHTTGVVDAADVAVLAAAVAVAATGVAAGRRVAVVTVWRTTRTVAVAVLVVQLVLGAVPAVSSVLAPTPTTATGPAVLVAAAVVLGCAAVVSLRPVRPGATLVLVLCGAQVAVVGADVLVGSSAAATVALGTLAGVVAAALPRGARAGTPSRTTPVRTALLPSALLVLPVVWTVLVGLPVLVTAGVLVVGGVRVVATAARPCTGGAPALDDHPTDPSDTRRPGGLRPSGLRASGLRASGFRPSGTDAEAGR